MMMKLIKSLNIVMLALFLQGCEKEMDLNYLLEHPLITKKEHTACLESASETKHCQLVMTAFSQLMDVVGEQQNDPEAFGQRILNLESKLGEAQRQLAEIKQTGPSSASEQAKVALTALKDEQRMLLAVAGLNSPN